MDRALDDVVRERSQKRGSSNSGGGNGNGNRNRRRTDRRGGVRKPQTGNPRGYSDSLAWVHDKYEGDASSGEVFKRGGSADARLSSQTSFVPPGAGKLKVENIHYELGHEELLGLFERQGPVSKLDLMYDRAGRSEGVAFVIYEREEDAKRAVQEFNGANANGQPIRLTFIKTPTSSKSLFDRIKAPSEERSASEPMRRGGSGRRDAKSSPGPDNRRDPTRRPTPPGIDRYVPPERRRERRSADEPIRGGERNRNGRDGGARSGGGGGGGGGNGGGRRGGENRGSGGARSRKTVEELDEEMNNYFAEAGAETAPAATGDVSAVAAVAPAVVEEDEEMIL